MRPDNWTPYVPYLIKEGSYWKGNQTTILSKLESGGYAIHFCAGYIQFYTQTEAVDWLLTNDYEAWNTCLKHDSAALNQSNEAFKAEYWARQASEPKPSALPKTDPTALLRKLGLV